MERPKPTKKIILGLVGHNSFLAEAVHHGLADVPIGSIYPYLNLDEAVAFAAASRKFMESNPRLVGLTVRGSLNLHSLFSEICNRRIDITFNGKTWSYSNAFSWINSRKVVSASSEDTYERLNPYRRNLRERLGAVPTNVVEELEKRLVEPVNEYVFECRYHKVKMARDGDNHRLVVMDFQTVFPKRGSVVPNYAAEISRIISGYPRDVHERFIVSHKGSRSGNPKQGELF